AADPFQATFLTLARDAASIRQRQSLSSYLYGVAYRTALMTRRRQRRQKTQSLPLGDLSQTDAVDVDALREARVVLDEEVMRLPDRLRRPVVLCYFQGLTQEQAARQLGWSLRTCKRRLEEARKLLSERLGRRGLGLSIALLPMLLSEAAVKAVPPALLSSTVKASLLVSSRAGVLATMGLPRSAFFGGLLKLRSVLGGLVLLAGGAVGLTAVFISRPATDPTAEPPSVNQAPAPRVAAPVDRKVARPEAPAQTDGPTALVCGKVLDAAGHALPFATVTALARRPFRPGEQALRDEVVT